MGSVTERARADVPDSDWFHIPDPDWFHVECFLANRESLLWFRPASDLPGYESHGDEDQEMLKGKLLEIAPE